MGLEPRSRTVQVRPMANPSGEEPGEGPKRKVESFEIRKRLVYEAWQRVQANGGAPGVDAVSIERFAADEANNLYKLWNRMSSGSYFPGPVRAVEIPKDQGQGVRVLGVPNTADRVAQTAAAMLLEEKLEPIFHPDSYGTYHRGLPDWERGDRGTLRMSVILGQVARGSAGSLSSEAPASCSPPRTSSWRSGRCPNSPSSGRSCRS